ncbi:MAG: hypothetical protein GF411_20600 [Candidatus Lokiarchaeota archaeon]|nr:hypothetical protein [Candidatus Lokiarchaeota archaeon]
MLIIWGGRLWRIISGILIILIVFVGTFLIANSIIRGYVLWWYDLSIILFGFTLLGLLFLVQQGWRTLKNIVKFGFNPDKETDQDEETESMDSDQMDTEDSEYRSYSQEDY